MSLISTLGSFFLKVEIKHIKMEIFDIKESLLKKTFAKNENSKCW